MNWQDIFVSVEQLKVLSPADVVIFDCRFQLAVGDQPAKGKAFHDEEHITGAHYLDLEHDLSAPLSEKSSRHPLPTRAQFMDLAQRFGLTPNSKIVCYDQGNLAFAARAWFLFHHFGFHCVRILAEGWPGWQRLSSEPIKSIRASFSPVYVPIQVIDLESAVSGKYQLIDAREAHRYQGKSEPIDPVAGSIPDAINAVWLDNFDENKALKCAEWHQSRWQSIPSDKPKAHYCGSGVTALVNLISALLADCGKQYFYPGGWSEYLHSDQFIQEQAKK